MTTEKLLREYVREIIKEDDGGAYGGLAMADVTGSPWGINYGDKGDFYKIFIAPFADVVDTTLGKTKEMAQKTKTLVHTAFETIATTLIPALSSDYKEIFDHEAQEIEKIKKEYGDVYQANWDAFRDNDVFWTAFCYNPAAVLTTKFVYRSPKAAIKLISALTGGEIDGWLDKVAKKFPSGNPPKTGLEYDGESPSGSGGGGMGGGFDMGGYGAMEGVIREDGNGKKQPDLASVLLNKKVMAKVQGSPIVKKMQQETQAAFRGALENVYKKAKAVSSANSLQDLEHKTGKKIKGLEQMQQVPQNERQQVEQTILASTKKSMASFYAKNLEAQLKKAQDAGVPDDSQYVKDITSVISKIKAL